MIRCESRPNPSGDRLVLLYDDPAMEEDDPVAPPKKMNSTQPAKGQIDIFSEDPLPAQVQKRKTQNFRSSSKKRRFKRIDPASQRRSLGSISRRTRSVQ